MLRQMWIQAHGEQSFWDNKDMCIDLPKQLNDDVLIMFDNTSERRFLTFVKILHTSLQLTIARKTRLALLIAGMIFTIFSMACAGVEPYRTSQTTSTTKNPIYILAETGVGSNNEWAPYIELKNGVPMALVPSGCFTMGITDAHINYLDELNSRRVSPSSFRDQQPAHQVCYKAPFWIDVYEVTQAQFKEFAGQAANPSHFTGVDLPRERITWDEAAAFCKIRGARLPTEAEWEYAARGPDGLLFPWGNTFDCRKGNFDDETGFDDAHVIEGFPNCDSYPTTAPVGKFIQGASWIGAQDLSGNVWEWVADWYDDTTYSTQGQQSVDPQGPLTGKYHALRGGAWSIDEIDHLLATFRGWYDPQSMGDISLIGKHLGFRCALPYH